jgi:hypothetical protein
VLDLPGVVLEQPGIGESPRALQVCLLVAVRTGVETVRLCPSRDLHELGGAAGETERIAEDGDRFAHNPEVAGSNPVPATKLKWPPEITPGAIFMGVGNTLGTLNSLIILRGIFLTQTPTLPEKECGSLLGGVGAT